MGTLSYKKRLLLGTATLATTGRKSRGNDIHKCNKRPFCKHPLVYPMGRLYVRHAHTTLKRTGRKGTNRKRHTRNNRPSCTPHVVWAGSIRQGSLRYSNVRVSYGKYTTLQRTGRKSRGNDKLATILTHIHAPQGSLNTANSRHMQHCAQATADICTHTNLGSDQCTRPAPSPTNTKHSSFLASSLAYLPCQQRTAGKES